MLPSVSAIERYREHIVADLRELIRIPSVRGEARPDAPFGPGPARALRYVLERGAALGFATRTVDNVAGHVQYGVRGPLVGVLVHLDVVPAGDAWKHDPFEGEVEDGCVFGRGASDNKGPAVAALYCLRAYADLVADPPARIRIIFGTNEESGMACMRRYFAAEELPEMGFSPDAAYPLFNREKGIFNATLRASRSGLRLVSELSGGEALNSVASRAVAAIAPQLADVAREAVGAYRADGCVEPRVALAPGVREDGGLRLVATGVSAHGGSPEKGVSAIAHLVALLAQISGEAKASGQVPGGEPVEPELRALGRLVGFETTGESLGIACRDEESGALSVNWGTLVLEEDSIEAALNIRYPVTGDFERIVSVLERTTAHHGFSVEVSAHLPPLYLPEDHPLIVRLLRAYERVTGERASPRAMAGGTYARMLANRGVAFGANFADEDTRGHRPDEFIRVESLMRHARICTEALLELAQ
ncbi:MAG: Sapep family Mn(2+)-dependent dipeptidase [Spirochaetota bacterium]